MSQNSFALFKIAISDKGYPYDKLASDASEHYAPIALGLGIPLGVYGYNAGIERAYRNRSNKLWGEAYAADAALDDAFKFRNILLENVMYKHPKFTGADILKNGVPIPRYEWKTTGTRSDLLDGITWFKDLGYDISQLEAHPDYLNLKNSIDQYKNVEANLRKLQEDAVTKIRKAGTIARKDRVYKVLERLQGGPKTAVISGLLGLGGLGYAGYHAYRALQDN